MTIELADDDLFAIEIRRVMDEAAKKVSSA